jgi:hypothetical protein
MACRRGSLLRIVVLARLVRDPDQQLGILAVPLEELSEFLRRSGRR